MAGSTANSLCFVAFLLLALLGNGFKCGGGFGLTQRSAYTQLCATEQPSIVNVELGDRSYPIYIGRGMIVDDDMDEQLHKHVTSKKALVVTNTKVGPLYSAKVRSKLEKKGVEVFEVVLPDGEEFKTMDVLMLIINAAMDAKLDRKSTMVALGGGVIGDMCGFAAAIYQRGVKFVQIPTTTMAMVDSSVGGKTAVNHPSGKNMIGAFYQPDAVIIDIDTLDTLPDREYKSGIAEIIKYGLIRDEAFFDWQDANMHKILARDPAVVTEMIKRSVENKAEVVAADEREGGVRATLNLGHTFGHAIEAGLGYGAWLHGEAVATGMCMAAEMSTEMTLTERSVLERTVALMGRAGLPTTIANNVHARAEYDQGAAAYDAMAKTLTTEKFLDYMSMDKKVSDGQLSLVLLEGARIGKSLITNKFDEPTLRAVVARYTDQL